MYQLQNFFLNSESTYEAVTYLEGNTGRLKTGSCRNTFLIFAQRNIKNRVNRTNKMSHVMIIY
jgi:hypothetical protein